MPPTFKATPGRDAPGLTRAGQGVGWANGGQSGNAQANDTVQGMHGMQGLNATLDGESGKPVVGERVANKPCIPCKPCTWALTKAFLPGVVDL
jgi:hypothetical protein